MTIRLHTDADRCLYEQIYEHIKNEIRDGKLLAGERLPSTRSLAEYLQVARSTVEYAYGQLQDEGYIEARPCRGYFVCPMEELPKPGLAEREETEEAVEPEPALPYDFSPYEIDMSGFPFSVWKKITGSILNGANSDLFARGLAQGDYELRSTISRYLHSSRGVNCVPEQIVVGAGNDYLLMLLEKLLGRHVRVAMENPTYIRSCRLFQSFAYPVVTVGMDDSGMLVEELECSGAQTAYVMPSHQFPMGTVMPIGRRMELLRWADGKEGRYLIEDDYDSEFRFRGKPIPALQASDKHGRVIYIGTFSKAIAPAIRVSFMVLPESLLEKYRRECAVYSCTVSRIDQRILNEFIRDGYFERHLNKMRKIYRTKHDFLLEELKPLQKRFRVSGENAGLHFLLSARDDSKEAELVRQAAGQGVKVYGLSDYMVVKEERGAALLLGFGGMAQEQLAEGVAGLCRAWL